MPARLKLALAVAAGCAITMLIVVSLVANQGAAPLDLVEGFAGAQRPPSIPPQNFTLHDESGSRVSLSDYAGQVTIVTFLYSTCQTTCPVIAQQIRGALDELGQPVPALAISVDPKNDTPLSARRFLIDQSMLGRMKFLLGTRAQLTPIWKAFGIQPQTNQSSTQSDHTAYVVLIDKTGKQRIGFPDSALTPEALAHDVRMLEAQPAPARMPKREML